MTSPPRNTLVLWPKEPPFCQFLGLYYGAPPALERFIQLWFDKNGDTEIWRYPADKSLPAPLWRNGEPPQVLAFSDFPDLHLLGWILRNREEWTLFYGRTATDGSPDAVEEARKALAQNSRPRGWYQPWTLSLREPLPHLDERVGLVLPDGELAELGDPSRFASLFKGQRARVMTRRGPEPETRATPAPAPRTEFPIPIRLREVRARDADQVVRARIDALRRQIDALQMELEQCQAEVELSEPPRYLWVYPEFPEGSHRERGADDLRDWFCRTPDTEIRRYQHTRVQLELPPEVLPALHLVRLPEDSQESRAALPTSAYRLTQDLRWKAADREVFVPHDRRLEPPPPRHQSNHVREAMERCLWGGAADAKKTLIFLLLPNGEECRFLVPGDAWASLDKQVPTLNFQLADPPTRAQAGHDAKAVAKQLVARSNQDAAQHFRELEREMTEQLDTIWERERQRAKEYQEKVRGTLDTLKTLEPLLNELETLRTQQWKTWIDFLTTTLDLDRETLLGQRELRDQIQALDAVRVEITEVNATPFASRKRQLSATLRALASTLERGS